MAQWLIYDPEEVWDDGLCFWPWEDGFTTDLIIAKAGPNTNWNFMGVTCGRGVPVDSIKRVDDA